MFLFWNECRSGSIVHRMPVGTSLCSERKMCVRIISESGWALETLRLCGPEPDIWGSCAGLTSLMQVEVCVQCILCFLSQRCLICIELFHLCVFRKARCSLCGGSVRWSHGAERYEIPSRWHWNVHHQGTPEYHRVVSAHTHTHTHTHTHSHIFTLISGGSYSALH